MAKKNTSNPTHCDLFRKAMHGTKLHHHDKVPLKPHQAKIRAQVSQPDLQEELEPLFYFDPSKPIDDPVQSDDFLEYRDASLAPNLLRKLGKGQYNVQAVLDLHGKTVATAQVALENFLRRCLADECRVVLIIHGKGHRGHAPILKNYLYQWLRQLEMVLAFRSADKAQGGNGALYVLLRRVK